jgi:hypothetical protein
MNFIQSKLECLSLSHPSLIFACKDRSQPFELSLVMGPILVGSNYSQKCHTMLGVTESDTQLLTNVWM